jgi:hypothetical protein
MSLLLVCLVGAEAQPLKTKTIDGGGSGMFKAIAVKETGLTDFVVYRPKDMLHAHARCGAMPLLLWANGGCSDTNIGYERMLTEIASHGYVVVAIGEMQDKHHDRKEGHTSSTEVKHGLDWMIKQCTTKGTDYYNNIDTAKIAVVYKKAIGLGYSLFASKSVGFDYTCAFANASIALFDSVQGAQIELGDEKADKAALAAKYADENSDPIHAAKDGYIDAVIEPQFVKQYLIAALQMLER